MLTKFKIYTLATLLLVGFGIAFGQLPPSLIQQKLHPTFQAVVNSDGQSLLSKFGGRLSGPTLTMTNGKALFDAIITTSSPDVIRAKGIHVNSTFNGYTTAQVTREDILNLIQLSEVQYVDPGSINYPTLDRSLPEIGANLLQAGFLNNTPYKGKGAIVLIYDTGIDWRHLDFRDPVDTMKSRILAIWDQTITASGSEATPSGFSYGVEYTKQQIENEFSATPPRFVREKDVNGHGTHVSGIAAGNGSSYYSKYVGVAPEADIIFVKGGDGSFSETKMIDGLTYAQGKAASYGKSIVVNWSIGGQGGSHDGTRPYEVAVDNFSSTSGRAVVVAAGNDGGRSIHTSGTITPSSPVTFTISVPSYTPSSGTNNDAFILDIWLGSNASISATIISPTGVTFAENADHSGTSSNTSDGTIDLYNYISSYNGLRNVQAYVHDQTASGPKSGTWTITLSGASSNIFCDAWLSSWTVGTSTVTLVGGNTQKTVTMPGTSNSAITVGSYVTKNMWPTYSGFVYGISTSVGDISSFSGLGPSRDGRQKPDIAAPGQEIGSALSADVSLGSSSSNLLPDTKHQIDQGTSMAAPAVTGAVALLLGISPGLTANQIKSILTNSTNTDLSTSSTPNMTWGYGKLDVFRAALKVLNPSGGVQRKTYSYDADGTNYYFTPYLTGTTKYAVRFTPTSSGVVTGVELFLAYPGNNPIVGNGSVVCEIFTNIAGSLGGIPGTRIGNSVQFPFSRLGAATNNFIDVSSANIAVTAGQDYHVVLSVVNPSDKLTVLQDDGTSPTNRSSVYSASRWVNVADPTSGISPCNIRARAIVTSLSNSAPSAPVSLSPANNATGISTSPVLSWSSVSSATSYNLQISTGLSFSSTIVNQTGITSTSDTINGLAINTLYYWRVSATNAGGTSQYSTPWSFTTTAAAPSAPVLVSPVNNATGIATTTALAWNASVGATTYRLQVSTLASFTTMAVDDSTISGTTRAVGPLQRNMRYYWRVIAKSNGGSSNWSVSWSFITGGRARGDVDGNGLIQVADAALVLRHVVGIAVLSDPDALYAADADNDGSITAYDASLILQAAAGLIPPLTSIVTNGTLGKVSVLQASGKLEFSSPEATTNPNVVKVGIKLSNPANVYSVALVSKADFGLMTIDAVNASMPDGWYMKWNVVNGELRIAAAGTTPLSGGNIATIMVHLKSQEGRLSFSTDAMLNENFQSLGAFEVAAIPAVFALEQNYPNPFNPSTTIRYGLPKSASVSLNIYNTLGQLVAILVDGKKEAGYYEETWNATVPSGIYFYRLQAGEFVETKKMILLK